MTILCRLFGHKWIPNYDDEYDGPDSFCMRCDEQHQLFIDSYNKIIRQPYYEPVEGFFSSGHLMPVSTEPVEEVKTEV